MRPGYRRVRPCSYCHVPYHHAAAPFSNMRLVPCGICRRKWVAETVLATVEPPPGLKTRGGGVLVEARVVRVQRRTPSGEADAMRISDHLPFVEYELQRQLMLKLRLLGMNAAWAVHTQVQIGAALVIGTIAATACYVESLPPPAALQISRGVEVRDAGDRRLVGLHKAIEQAAAINRQRLAALAPRRPRRTYRRRGNHRSRPGETGEDGGG
ncbi:unnamed protein product, partial [Phaeothamnion confervicola]